MNRRAVLRWAGGFVLASPLRTLAQQPTDRRRIAFVHSGIPAAELTEAAGPFWVKRFMQEMRRLGHIEGRNLVIERSSAQGDQSRFDALAREVVAREPDVIIANSNALVSAFQAATSAIPIIGIVADPIRTGMIANLARPEANLTGVTVDAGIEMLGKRLEILREMLPSADRVVFLGSEAEWRGPGGQELRDVGRRLALDVAGAVLRQTSVSELESKFAEFGRDRPDALVVSASGDLLAQRRLIVDLASSLRVPTIYPYRDYVELGGLVAYAPDVGEMAERLAAQVHRVLEGARPGDIPFHQATKFALVLNLAAGRRLGMTFPPAILIRADDAID